MRVVWATHRDPFAQNSGGAEQTIRQVGERLAGLGHSVEVYTHGTDRRRHVVGSSNFRVFRFSSFTGLHFSLLLKALRFEPDTVFICDLAHAVPWFFAVLKRVPAILFFRHLHRRTLTGQVSWTSQVLLSGLERSYKWLYHDRVFVTESEDSARDLRDIGISPDSIDRIPPGVDITLFYPRTKTASPTVIYFGGLRKYKRPEHAVIAFSAVHETFPGARLFIVGSGPSFNSVRRLVRSLGLTDSVTMTGRLPTEQLARLLGSVWVNIH